MKEYLNDFIKEHLYLLPIIVIIYFILKFFFSIIPVKFSFIELITIFTFIIVVIDYISKQICEARTFIIKFTGLIENNNKNDWTQVNTVSLWPILKDYKYNHNNYSKYKRGSDNHIEMELEYYKLGIISKLYIQITLHLQNYTKIKDSKNI